MKATSPARTRRLAIETKSKRYIGSPCIKHPKNKIRWLISGNCCECTKAHAEIWRLNNPDKLRISRRDWDRNNPEKAMLQRTRRRAKVIGVEFTLTLNDIRIPKVCPVFGTPLIRLKQRATKRDMLNNSPSIDRIDNTKGYTPNNIIIISYKANFIKGAHNLNDLIAVAEFYKKLRNRRSK